MYCVVVRAKTKRNDELIKTRDRKDAMWKRYEKYLPGSNVCLEQQAKQKMAKHGSTIVPASRSTMAKLTLKNVTGVRKHLNGSLQIATRRRPLLTTVIGDRMENRQADAYRVIKYGPMSSCDKDEFTTRPTACLTDSFNKVILDITDLKTESQKIARRFSN